MALKRCLVLKNEESRRNLRHKMVELHSSRTIERRKDRLNPDSVACHPCGIRVFAKYKDVAQDRPPSICGKRSTALQAGLFPHGKFLILIFYRTYTSIFVSTFVRIWQLDDTIGW